MHVFLVIGCLSSWISSMRCLHLGCFSVWLLLRRLTSALFFYASRMNDLSFIPNGAASFNHGLRDTFERLVDRLQTEYTLPANAGFSF